VPLTARRLWSRLSNMSWDEFETRARQEVSKRLDLALCGIGLQPARNGLCRASGPSGNFFFSPGELASRVTLVRKHLPHEAEEILRQADEICRHRFRLLGYRDLDYGAEIDWHLDAVNGQRSPLIPWFKIDFLDFAEVGDHKVMWELSRHQHLVTLAKARLLTNEERYSREIFAQWYSWQKANPYPLGANWASSLEVAFRSFSWIWFREMLRECPAVPAGFHEDLLRGLALNGRHIERYLSTYFSPNTHLLGEAVALFFIGAMCPQISSAERWERMGWQIVQEEAHRQVRPDGVYFEQSLYYHVYALDLFLHARLLASRNRIEISSEFDLVLKRMLSVIQSLAQAGPPDGFGDDDGGRVFNSRRNHAEHLIDPLAIGAALFHDEEPIAGSLLTEEAIWLLGEQAVFWNKRKCDLTKMETHVFADGGLFIAASSNPPQQLVIDAGPQGTGRSGHGHADALSLKLAFSGRNWLVDAGTFCYIGHGNERNDFRGTRAHNTVTIDGVDQAEPDGPFGWKYIPEATTESWITGETFTFFAGSHSGYERLPEPARHQRFVFHRHGAFWLVRDVVEGRGSHLLETSWHLAQDLKVSSRGGSFDVSSRERQSNEFDRLTLLPVADAGWRCEELSEFVSPAYGLKTSAPVVLCSARVELPAEHAMMLIPGVEEEPSGTFLRDSPQHSPAAPQAAYRYERGGEMHVMIFQPAQNGAWSYGPWQSDARFFYFCVREHRVEHLAFCNATFAKLRDQPLISRDATLQWLERSRVRGEIQFNCSDAVAGRSFYGTVLDSEIDS
jgi:hypothetical protein